MAFLATLWAARYVFERASVIVAWRVRLRVHRDILAEATARLHRLPLAYHQSRGVGETMTRLDRGVGSLIEGLSQLTFQAIPSAIYVAVAVAIMLHLCPLLALWPPSSWCPPPCSRRRRTAKLVDREKAGLDRWCTIYDRFQQVLRGHPHGQGLRARERDEHARFIGQVDAGAARGARQPDRGRAPPGRAPLWGNLGRIAVLGAGGVLVLQGRIGTGTLVAFLGYVGGLYGPAQALLGLYETARKAEIGLDAIFGVLDAEDTVPDPPCAPAARAARRHRARSGDLPPTAALPRGRPRSRASRSTCGPASWSPWSGRAARARAR